MSEIQGRGKNKVFDGASEQMVVPRKGKPKGEERYCRERRGREVKSSALHSEVQMPSRHPNRDTVCSAQRG